MCGIAGILNFDGAPVNKQELSQMSRFMQERGPDDNGIYHVDHIGLVHRRLSIVDLTQGGHQPMLSQNKQAAIVFNGEIYNFLSLKSELLKEGSHFENTSDTEVLLEGYQRWGIESLLSRIDGMFAFALIDLVRNQAFLCRDRFGKKPLYYLKSDKKVKFASDIRSIKATENNFSLNYQTIDYYLSELSSPQPHTIWNEVSQVNPAHYISISLDSGAFSEDKYWSLEYSQKLRISLEEAQEQIEETLERAVIKRIHGDVPVGSFLSAGIDSGLVTAFLAKNSKNQIDTFTVSLKGHKDDEGLLARNVAERYETNHTEVVVEPNDLLNVSDRLIEYCGEPFADSSLVPSYYICSSIGKTMKVALSGDGGDEFFGGYHDYKTAFESDFLRESKNSLLFHSKILRSKLAYRIGLSSRNLGSAHKYLNMSGYERLYRGMGFSIEDKNKLYSESFMKLTGSFTETFLNKIWNSNTENTLLDQLIHSSQQTRLLNDYLVKIDRASMINSLEVRSPFLDHQLAELASKIHSSFHLNGGINKYFTKSIARKYLGDEIVNRPKTGFGIPLKDWISGDLKPRIKEVMSESQMVKDGFFRENYIDWMLDQHFLGMENFSHRIWALYVLERWLQLNR